MDWRDWRDRRQWLNGLFLQQTRICFPEPTLVLSQLPVTLALTPLGTSIHTHISPPLHMHTLKLFLILEKGEGGGKKSSWSLLNIVKSPFLEATATDYLRISG